MVQKRHLAEEGYDVSPKHPRLEQSCQLVSFSEFPLKDLSGKLCTLGEADGCFSDHITERDNKFESGKICDLRICAENDVEDILPGNISTSSWASSLTSEDDVRSEEQIHILCTPEHSPIRPRRVLIQPEDAYSCLFGYPLKQVSIGPEFQADIPEWCGYDAKDASVGSVSVDVSTLSSPASEVNSMSYVEEEIKLVGSCVIPMPEVDPTSCNRDGVGRGRPDCCCEIPGSGRCVQQHIGEARENLRKTIGVEKFLELGFDNMGEIVAEKWSEEDEQLFHEIVYSYPVSLGKNFWDHLTVVFPSRTNQEIVSYYFNVFVLRRRAEQNRYDPVNIDSDNDEWQGNYESEEDEDSCRNEILEYDSHEYDEGIENPIFDYYEDVDFHGFKGITSVSETCPKASLRNYSFDEQGTYHDFQDDSCRFSDTGDAPQLSRLKADNSKPSPWGSHEFLLEPSDSKVWDMGCLSCPRNKADFLPTGSMIEEVFGVGSWNFKVRDGKSF